MQSAIFFNSGRKNLRKSEKSRVELSRESPFTNVMEIFIHCQSRVCRSGTSWKYLLADGVGLSLANVVEIFIYRRSHDLQANNPLGEVVLLSRNDRLRRAKVSIRKPSSAVAGEIVVTENSTGLELVEMFSTIGLAVTVLSGFPEQKATRALFCSSERELDSRERSKNRC